MQEILTHDRLYTQALYGKLNLSVIIVGVAMSLVTFVNIGGQLNPLKGWRLK